MNVIWLVLASLVWTGLIAALAAWIAGAAVRPHFAQGVWRGAAALMALPWLAAGAAALWPAGAEAPLPAMEAFPGPAGAAMQAVAGAESAIAASAGPQAASLVWIMLAAGWGARLAAGLRAQLRLQKLKRRATPSRSDRAAAVRWAGALGLREAPGAAAIPCGSPFVAGLARRIVHIPQTVRDADTRSLIIAHECVHLARGDLVARPLERAVADLLWFSPFAWIARARLDDLREAVCDAETVALTGGDGTRYARALTGVARAARPGAAMPVSSLLPKGRKALERRVRRLVTCEAPAPNRAAAIAAGLAALAAAPLGLAQGLALDKGGAPLVEVAAARDAAGVFTHAVVEDPRARISSGFGVRQWNTEPKMHHGVDIAAPKGTPVCAPADARIVSVVEARRHSGYGNHVVAKLADGRKMRFASLDEVKVSEGDRLRAGDVLGTAGKSAKTATGSHVHVELWAPGVHGED